MNINRFTRIAFLLSLIALIAGLYGCDEVQQVLFPPDKPPEPPVAPTEIPIGVVLEQTGEYALYGVSMLEGFALARDHINNSGQLGDANLTFIVEDDQSSVAGAVEAVDKLIDQDNVSFITGFAISTLLEQVIPKAQESGVLLFSSVSSAPGLSARGDFIFRAALTSAVLNPPIVEETHAYLPYQTAAVIFQSDDTYSTLSNEELVKKLTALRVAVVATETYERGETDFFTQLAQIAETDPEMLFISGIGLDSSHIMIQARELMPEVRFAVPEMDDNMVTAAGPAAEGAITSISWLSTAHIAANQTFVQSYTERYGEAPLTWAAQSYATLHILATAIATAGSTDAAAVRDVLAHTADLETVLGPFSFNADGDAVYDPIVLTVKDGALEPFMVDAPVSE